MGVTNTDSLLRHRIIDRCLRDKTRRYTLDDLILACRAAFQEQNDKKKQHNSRGKSNKTPVSARTIQLDLQHMRDKKNGYAAPIVVYESKYYKYSDANYSIEKVKLKKSNYSKIEEIITNLKELSNFSEFKLTKTTIKILDEEIASICSKRDSVISYERKNRSLGLEYFDNLHDAIINKKVLCIGYYSSRSENIIPIIFYPFYLKEYRGRWYSFGYKDGMDGVYKLPLDRIRDLSYSILPFPDNYEFDHHQYFKDIIGVTKLSGRVREIEILVKNRIAPFVKINPLHHSQKIKNIEENGDMIFTLEIILNNEFYNIIYENRPYIEIVSPKEIGIESNRRIVAATENMKDYSNTNKSAESQNSSETDLNDGFNLFSGLL